MLIFNIQYWTGDREQAMALAKLMADIEPKKRDDVIMVFSARFDCPHDIPAIEYVSKKFRVELFKSRPHRTGWPGGPNDLMAQSYMWCVEQVRFKRFNADGVFFMESDDVPLASDWIDKIKAEWEECKAAGKQVLGCYLMRGDCGTEHINGNCIIHIDFWRQNRAIFTPGSGGWDADAWSMIKPLGYPSRLIWSDYGLGKPDYNPWKGCDFLFEPKRYRATDNPLYGQDLQPVFLHGPKIMDGIDCVRKKLGLRPR